MNRKIRGLKFVVIALCGVVSACGGASGGSGGSYTVDASKLSYGAVTNGEMTITAQDEFVTLSKSLSASDVTVTLERNDTVVATVDGTALGRVLGASAKAAHVSMGTPSHVETVAGFSETIEVDLGDKVEVIVRVEGVSSGDNDDLVGTAATTSSTPVALEDSSEGQGYAALADRDVVAAEAAYCDSFNDGLPDPADTSYVDAQLAFGCFFTHLMLLPESAESTTLLASVGESPFDLEGSILSTAGLFNHADEIEIQNYWPLFNYVDFDLPLAGIFRDHGFGGGVDELLQAAVDANKTTETLQSEVLAHVPELEFMESLLEISLAHSDFTYALPGELFYVSGDVDTTHNDLKLFMSATQTTLVNFGILQAYTIGVDIDYVMVDGAIDAERLVADLNGTEENGEDGVRFLTLSDPDAIIDQRDRYESAMTYLHAGLQTLAAGASSEFFDQALNQYDLEQGVDIASELIAALDGPTEMGAMGLSSLTLDLETFFTNPPDPSEAPVDAGDPFVLEDGVAKPVEGFFRDALETVAEF